MAYQFDQPENAEFRPGMLFLGKDRGGQEIGVTTERHAITFAGSGAGKGAGLIIPNLLRWPHNALIVDPKGENAKHTWQAREAMGQVVGVLDPFEEANVPQRLRTSINLLDAIDPESLTIREDLRVLADGLVMRHDPKHGDWQDVTVALIAGVAGFVKTTQPKEHQTLLDVAELLAVPNDALRPIFTSMTEMDGCAGLIQTAGSIGLAALDAKSDSPHGAALKNARESTGWMKSKGMQNILGASTFDLRTLKNGNASLFLVLPLKYLTEHARFLRLFVRAAVENAMAYEGGSRCLFILDEAYSLGNIAQLENAMGTVRSFHMHLWPIFQNIGQLARLYGKEGSNAFFANADAQTFFGMTDGPTLSYVSDRIDKFTPEEIAPPFTPTAPRLQKTDREILADKFYLNDFWRQQIIHTERIEEANKEKLQIEAEGRRRAEYDYAMRKVGTPRLSPKEVETLTGKGDADKVAASMIVFTKKGQVWNLKLAPWFEDTPANRGVRRIKESLLHGGETTIPDNARHAAPRPIRKEPRPEINADAALPWLFLLFFAPWFIQPFGIVTAAIIVLLAWPTALRLDSETIRSSSFGDCFGTLAAVLCALPLLYAARAIASALWPITTTPATIAAGIAIPFAAFFLRRLVLGHERPVW